MGAKWFNITKSDEGVQRLITCDGSTTVTGNGIKDITIPVDYVKYELKTVRVSKQNNKEKIIVKIFDSFDDMEVYKSNEKGSIYDILSIPVEDKKPNANGGNIYLRIENLGNNEMHINYEIKILNLR